MRHTSLIAILATLVLSWFPSAHAADLQGELKGILIWFYTLEVQEGKEKGNVISFKQTAGVSLPHHRIHDILPLSPQSQVSRADDGNWYLDLAQRLAVTKHRPLYLGQVLNISKSENVPIRIPAARNALLGTLKFDADLKQYLEDRKDLLIHDPAITEVRDRLIAADPRILHYIVAVDRFVHDGLKYGLCERPNTAVDVLSFAQGRCGEYGKLKQSLLRSAGIPTRDVYATRTDSYGPGIESGDDSHVWLQAFVPGTGWIAVPSTRKMNPPFLAYQGGYHPEGYFLRALDLYKHEEEIQKKVYTYNALRRSGGIRGNGMLLKINQRYFKRVQNIVSRSLDYQDVPSPRILREIGSLPQEARPLLYWFLISAPDEATHQEAAAEFVRCVKRNQELEMESFLKISPVLVSQRIDQALSSAN